MSDSLRHDDVVMMSSRRLPRTMIVLLSLASSTAALADEPEGRPPLPEPILAETTTDIDGTQAGEIEIETNALWLRSRTGGASHLELSSELEWLVTRRFGIKVEPLFERSTDAGASPTDSGGVSAGISWKLLQDFRHDFHLQLEALGRVPTDVSTTVDPGESPLPFSFSLQSGLQMGAWTLRDSLGVSAGGVGAHVPLRGSVAMLTGFESSGRFGFWGFEAEADGARTNPVVIALDLVPDLVPAGLPFALGFVLPYSIAADARAPSYGFFVRLFIESAREAAYARGESPKAP
jgi:hypothetical protein